ncbi:Cytochrome c556 [Devosia lucknowensis]|uniref:Cytochrome c556 n=1 Tax=Devosia lucknowensis TaxID=1096929 RepID=A0A1Y6EGE1_9HYPH|nr:cytochrome c [Devosia lucknowensis]SMQ61449.1 Cytochrome c556 [Devosia lucknowensis]
MHIRKASSVAIAGLLLAGVVGVFAQDAFTPPATPEEAIAMREAVMKENGGLLRGAANLTGDEAVAAAQTLLDNYTHMPELFPEGSEGGDALPAIWQNWEAFTAIIETGRAGAESALTAAQAGDTAGYAAGLQTVMGTCGQCHQQFRS